MTGAHREDCTTFVNFHPDDKGYMNRYQFVAGHRLFEILQLGKSIC
jgi:hypothetical protein